jgi:hypothetical protein
MYIFNIVAYRPAARQKPRDKQIFSSRCYVISREEQQRNGVFCAVRVDGGTCDNGITTKIAALCAVSIEDIRGTHPETGVTIYVSES